MKKTAIALATVAALLSAPALQAKPKMTGEERLAKILEGRVAGEPVNCIPLHRTRNTQIIDKTAIVYDAGSVIYVNRPENANQLDDNDVMVHRTSLSQLCNVDIVSTRENTHWFYTGSIALGEFVPYRKVAHAN